MGVRYSQAQFRKAENCKLMRVRIVNTSELHIISEDENLTMGDGAWGRGPQPFWKSGDDVDMSEEDYHRYQRIRDEWYAAHQELWALIRAKNDTLAFYDNEAR